MAGAGDDPVGRATGDRARGDHRRDHQGLPGRRLRPGPPWQPGGDLARRQRPDPAARGQASRHHQGNVLIVAVDTESAEFGVAPLIVRFVFGSEQEPAFLVAATDETALGHPQVAARWGDLFRDVIWAAFARLAQVSAAGKTPAGLRLSPAGLELTTHEPVPVVQAAREHVDGLIRRGLRQAPPAARA
jgi:hypothetical protein